MKTFAGFCLMLACAIALAAPPERRLPAPPGLNETQARIWGYWYARPDTKSVSIFHFDPAILQSNSITVNLGGRAYVFEGGARPVEPSPTTIDGVRGMSPRGVYWQGTTKDNGYAQITYTETGILTGGFILPPQRHTLLGENSVFFLIEHDPTWKQRVPFEPPRPESRLAPPRRASAASQ